MEVSLCRGEDLRENWNRKLCNRMQKPTGKPGVLSDRIYRCIEIERCIQDEANAAILGADSAESGHSLDDGDSALSEVVADDAFNDVGKDGDEENEEVAAINTEEVAAVNAADENVAAVTTVRTRPQSLPAFVGGGVGASSVESPAFVVHGVGASSAVSSTASQGGRLAKQIHQHHRGGVRHHCPATSAAEGGMGEKRQKILLIANGGLS